MKKNLLGLSLMVLTFAVGATMSLHADVNIGFESANGYTGGATIIGVDDNGVTGTKTWSNMFSTDSNSMAISAGTGVGGSQSFRITDNSNTTAYGTSVDLASAASLFTSTFKVTFSMAATNSGTAGNIGQFYLGYNGVAGGTQRYWTGVTCGYDGTLTLLTDSLTGVGASFYTLGNYSTFSNNWGEYITFELTIDPSTMKYTNVVVSGTKSTANKTAGLNVDTFHYGEIPYLSGNTTASALVYNLSLVAGGGSMGTVDFDNISISNVPEPGTAGLIALGLGALAARLARRRNEF